MRLETLIFGAHQEKHGMQLVTLNMYTFPALWSGNLREVIALAVDRHSDTDTVKIIEN